MPAGCLFGVVSPTHSAVWDMIQQQLTAFLPRGDMTQQQPHCVSAAWACAPIETGCVAAPQVRMHFRPEFINRIDEFIIFQVGGSRLYLGFVIVGACLCPGGAVEALPAAGSAVRDSRAAHSMRWRMHPGGWTCRRDICCLRRPRYHCCRA